MEALVEAGLGLDYSELRFARTTDQWIVSGLALRAEVAKSLRNVAAGVELIGSASVLGLLSKPIVDLAVGLSAQDDLVEATRRLEAARWIYRGDAGASGGHVFVLEARPWHRVAHLHVVEYEGTQWRNYLRFRDLLRASAIAREQYEALKLELAAEHGNDRAAYTEGKSPAVTAILDIE